MIQSKVLIFAGSTRQGSFNKQLARLAAEAARSTGAEVTFIDLRDLRIPLFDEDDESAHGMPQGARTFKGHLRDCDGMIIASPEYNSSITGVLKNALDWASREESDEEPSLVAFRGKVAALMSASPGALGGLRGLVHLRSILGNIGVLVLPDQVTVSHAGEAFGPLGKLNDARKQKQVSELAEKLAQIAGMMKPR